MNSIARVAGIILSGAAVLAAPAPSRAADASAVVVATQSLDRPDLGNYHYQVQVTWGPLSHGLSHLVIVLRGLDCPCLCDGSHTPLAFSTEAGTSHPLAGTPGNGCVVSYRGFLACNGDPSIGLSGPVIKWEPIPGQTCQPGKSGTGTFEFYSDWSPGPESVVADGLRIKEGQLVAYGDVRGNLPSCNCATNANEATSWGGIKSTYR